MNNLNHLFPEKLYHSYVVEGNPKEVSSILREMLEERGEINIHSPDLLANIYESFSIEDSQNIKEWYQNKPIDGKKKICIIGTNFINREAEQSLLKIIEEPTDQTHFFVIVPDSSLLLGTILSRVHLIKSNISDDVSRDNIAKDFFNATPLVRIEKISEIIKEFKDSDNSGGLRNSAILLINGLEKIVYSKWKEDINDNNKVFILNELKNCRNYLSTPGASVKMILEHIALVI